MNRHKIEKGFTLIELLIVIVVVVVVITGVVVLGRELGKAGASTINAATALLKQRDRMATIAHVPSSPVESSSGNEYIWTYLVKGDGASMDSISIGPISTDIDTTDIIATTPWVGSRTGTYIQFSGGRIPPDQSMSLSFRTTRDAEESVGGMVGNIYVNIIPATTGTRQKIVLTTVPKKPPP